ncbi:hypothetical protein ADK86_31320 [Streptomyces sp. NRRL F-5755]|nr:hypothetical protein ADK86_31320 [Streptomyces sp. NRRL F-5755]
MFSGGPLLFGDRWFSDERLVSGDRSFPYDRWIWQEQLLLDGRTRPRPGGRGACRTGACATGAGLPDRSPRHPGTR